MLYYWAYIHKSDRRLKIKMEPYPPYSKNVTKTDLEYAKDEYRAGNSLMLDIADEYFKCENGTYQDSVEAELFFNDHFRAKGYKYTTYCSWLAPGEWDPGNRFTKLDL